MKKFLIFAILSGIFTSFAGAQSIELQICKLYNDAGKARFEKKYGKAKVLEDRLSNLLDIYWLSVSSCPKEYQEYGWKAEPRQLKESHDSKGRFFGF